ncbi:putative transmembrane protein [Senna tora]|uniref:Putative transmembrane protein n=1 Tax=Senna tora TaxID=362788 RepID=A0A834TNX3_9FABA|nr:putative transmembrane protein [Senna tora]
MSKRCSVLEARLRELESIVHDLFLRHQSDHRIDFSEDERQKFAFVKNLLSAEISSSPPSNKPQRRLQRLAKRVAKLEDAFSNQQFDLMMHSSCSCTESCFEPLTMVESTETEDFPEGNDGEKKEEQAMVEWEGEAKKEGKKFGTLLVYEDAEDHFLEGFGHGGLIIGKKGLKEELVKKDIVLRNIEIRREEKSAFGPICGAMAFGIVVGMALMGFTMLKFSGCFPFMDQPCFITPT